MSLASDIEGERGYRRLRGGSDRSLLIGKFAGFATVVVRKSSVDVKSWFLLPACSTAGGVEKDECQDHRKTHYHLISLSPKGDNGQNDVPTADTVPATIDLLEIKFELIPLASAVVVGDV